MTALRFLKLHHIPYLQVEAQYCSGANGARGARGAHTSDLWSGCQILIAPSDPARLPACF